jgi:uncharacterized protein (DUF697 family)
VRQALTRVLPALPRLTRELEGEEPLPLLVSGPPSTALELSRLLTEGGDASLVRRVGLLDLERPELAGSPAVVYVVKGTPTPADEHALRRADRRRIPIVCLILGDAPPDGRLLPYVLATDVVRCRALDEPTLAAIARRIAIRAPDAAWALARRLPALRGGVQREQVARASVQAAVLAALSDRVPGPDLPALALIQIRMALRLEAASGREARGAQGPAVGGVLAGGLAFRGLARLLTRALPLPAAAVRAGVAYGGTRALGEAALALEGRASSGGAGTVSRGAEDTEPGSGEREPRTTTDR